MSQFCKNTNLAWRRPGDSKTQGNPALLSLGIFDAAPGQPMVWLMFWSHWEGRRPLECAGSQFCKNTHLAWCGPEDSKTHGNPELLSLGIFDAAPCQPMVWLMFWSHWEGRRPLECAGSQFCKNTHLAWCGPEDSKTHGNPELLSLGIFNAAPCQPMDWLKFWAHWQGER